METSLDNIHCCSVYWINKQIIFFIKQGNSFPSIAQKNIRIYLSKEQPNASLIYYISLLRHLRHNQNDLIFWIKSLPPKFNILLFLMSYLKPVFHCIAFYCYLSTIKRLELIVFLWTKYAPPPSLPKRFSIISALFSTFFL